MRTETTLSALVAQLSANCGDMFEACRDCGVSTIFVRQWRKDDVEVDKALTEAEQVGAMRLESAAIQRAVHGIDKNVYYKGEIIDTEKQYSDTLLTTLLKARVPGFKSEAEGGNHFHAPTQINIMPRAENYEQWLEMKAQTLNAPAPQLEAPRDDALEADFTDVSDAAKATYSLMASPFEGLGL